MRLVKSTLSRIAVWLLTIWVGITVVFFIQRMMPSDPVQTMLSKMTSQVGIPSTHIANINRICKISLTI